jgi:hypothetical protein
MASIRKVAYAALLLLSMLSVAPTLASAQGSAHGQFTLSHEVHWENAVVPAGEYKFAYDPGTTGLLMLTKLDGPHAGFMMLVHDVDEYRSSGADQLVVAQTGHGSYVREMQLPRFGMVLHFPAPEEPAQIAERAAAITGPGQ